MMIVRVLWRKEFMHSMNLKMMIDGLQDDSPDPSDDESVDKDDLGAEDVVIDLCFNFT